MSGAPKGGKLGRGQRQEREGSEEQEETSLVSESVLEMTETKMNLLGALRLCAAAFSGGERAFGLSSAFGSSARRRMG